MTATFDRVGELSLNAVTRGGAADRRDFIDALIEGFLKQRLQEIGLA